MQISNTLIFLRNMRSKLCSFLFCLILSCASPLSGHVDLEGNIQDFVLETKRIIIPGYPDAFNPSIIEWNGRILLSFRTRNLNTERASLIGFVWLDKDFSLISDPVLLEIDGEHIQDPRLIMLAQHLYMAYSDLYYTTKGSMRRMCLAEVMTDGARFFVTGPEFLLEFEGEDRKFEKNWVPFVYNDFLLLSYTISPHKVFLPLFGEGRCTTFSTTKAETTTWKWGEIRGGTQALMIGDRYLGFFHSSIEMKSQQSEGNKIPHYFMGAYTFSDNPPFNLMEISPTPIIGPRFYNGKVHKTWKPLRVVFPGGFIFDDTHIYVAYGRQDHEVWIVKLDRAGLMESLRPLN